MTGWLRGFRHADVLTDADVALVERLVVTQTWPDGHVFVREGARARAVTAELFFLLAGSVQVRASAPDGGFGVSRVLAPGQVFGAVALVADVPRTATCTALGPVTAGRLDRRTFDELFRRDVGVHARFQLMIARYLADDLRALRRLVLDAAAGSPRG